MGGLGGLKIAGRFKTKVQTKSNCRPFFSCWDFSPIPGNSDTTDAYCRDFSRVDFQLEKKGLQLGLVCTLVLIFLGGFQSSHPSHPPVPNRSITTLFRILKDNKEYKRTRKDHFSFHGRVTGGLREG